MTKAVKASKRSQWVLSTFTKNFEKLPWRGPCSEERVPFETSSILTCSRHQNLRWWPRYRREWPGTGDSSWKLANGTFFSTGKFPTGKQRYLYKIPFIPGNFQVERTENVFHWHPNRKFRNFLVNGKRPVKRAKRSLNLNAEEMYLLCPKISF